MTEMVSFMWMFKDEELHLCTFSTAKYINKLLYKEHKTVQSTLITRKGFETLSIAAKLL